jgi:hypothetical protein
MVKFHNDLPWFQFFFIHCMEHLMCLSYLEKSSLGEFFVVKVVKFIRKEIIITG